MLFSNFGSKQYQTSFSPDHDTSPSVQKINECFQYDNNIKEYFNILGNSQNVKYFQPLADPEISASNIFSLSTSMPYPSLVKKHYTFGKDIAISGCLPEINRYYYIIDNKFFLWKMNGLSFNDKNVEQIMEEEKVIIAVTTFEPSKVFFTKDVDSLLAVATPTYIKIYPIQNDFINPTKFYISKISFTPNCMCGGYEDQLLIGASDGHIYLLQFEANSGVFGFLAEEGLRPPKCLTACGPIRVLKSYFSFSISPISKIVCDKSERLIATIDNRQKICIYSYNNGSVDNIFSFVPPKGTFFATILNVSKSESYHLRFVAVTTQGDRYFFGSSDSLVGKTKIALRGEQKAPAELKGEKVVDAYYFCGYTAFLCQDCLVGTIVINNDSESCYEYVAKVRLDGRGISISGVGNPIDWLETHLLHAPIVAQHFMAPIELFVLTSSGGSTLRFHPMCEVFRQQLIEEHFLYREKCDEIMKNFAANDESLAICLLLAALHPEETDNYIFIASEYNRLNTLGLRVEENAEKFDEVNDDDRVLTPLKLTPLTHSFFVRTERLINIIWDCPIFYRRDDDFFAVSPQFSFASPDILKRLNQVNELIKAYISKAQLSMDQDDKHGPQVLRIEIDQLKNLSVFVNDLIEILKFVRIIRKQKVQIISLPFTILKIETTRCLENSTLNPTTQPKKHLITALREYVNALFVSYQNLIDNESNRPKVVFRKIGGEPTALAFISPSEEKLKKMTKFEISTESIAARPWIEMESELHLLTSEISHECPNFMNSPEALIIRAQFELQEASIITDEAEKKRHIHNAAKTFLTNHNVDYDIRHVCSEFINQGFEVYAVKLASSRANIIDDAQRGYYWYMNGCNESEFNSKQMFEEVSKVYECAFDAAYTDEGLKAILETKDDLFILLVFQHLLKTNEIDRLLKIDSELVLDFLKENDPRLVWKYFIAHGRYKEAIIDLIKYASDASSIDPSSTAHQKEEITFDQRIKNLQIAFNQARSHNLINLMEEAAIRIECAKIQKDLHSELAGEPLQTIETLFTEAEQKCLWSFMLRLIALSKVDNIDKRDMDLKTIWYNYLAFGDGFNDIQKEPLSEFDTCRNLKKLIDQIGLEKDVFDPDYLVPVFETFRHIRGFRPEWVVQTLTALQVDRAALFKSYSKLINTPGFEEETTNHLIFAALWLLSQGAKGDLSSIHDKIKQVLESPGKPYYKEIQELMTLFE